MEPKIHGIEVLQNSSKELDKEFQDNLNRESPEEEFDIDWKFKPKLADLKADLNNSKSYHDEHMNQILNWRSILKAKHLGDTQSKTTQTRSSIQPKLARKMLEWRVSSMSEPFLNNEEIFSVTPRTFEDREKANTNSILLNYQFRNCIPLTNFIGQYVRALASDGTVVVKPSWVFSSKKVTKEVPVFGIREGDVSPEFRAAFEAALGFYEESPSQYLTEVPDAIKKSVEEFIATGNVFEFVPIDYEYIDTVKIVENHPYAEVFPIDNVYMDPSAGSDYKKGKFVIYRYESSIAALKKDGRYKNLDSIDVKQSSWNTSEGIPKEGNDFDYQDRAKKRIEIFEYWGYFGIYEEDVLIPIIVTWAGNTIIRMEESPFSDELLPLIVAVYMPKQESAYGEPDAELLEDGQKLSGAITRGIVDILARNANGQRGMPKNMLDQTNKLKFQRGEDYEYNPNFNPDAQIIMSKMEDIPNSAFQVLSMVNSESESLTGVKAFSEGLTQNSLGKVATSVRGVLDAASKRESDILRRAAEGIEELGRRFLSMNADFLEEEEVIRITNDRFVKIFRKEVAGKYDLKVSIMTAEETAARSDELTFMLQTLAPSLDPAITKIMLAEYARINKLPDVAHAIKNYQPQPDPFTQQMQMLQLQEQYLKVEQAKLNLGTTQIDNALTQAKTATEYAKASKTQSEADINSLDFVEQESGVKQARDVEKVQAQAMGNIRLEERKAELQAMNSRREAINAYLNSAGRI